MDRLEIAQQKYDQIAPQPLQLDEQKSDEIEEWLRDYVVPLVADLQRNPAFRRHVNFGIERLAAETDTRERLQVVAVSDALVDCAAELERIGLQDEFRDLMTDRDLLQELNDRIYGVSSTASAQEDQNQGRDPRCIAAKMVEQPWFDLVMSLDFPYRADHLYVQTDDSSLDRAFDKFRPGIPVLGDGITRMLFARIDFWMHYLQGVWNQILMRIMQTSDDPHHEYETFFMTKHRLDNCVEELRATCLSGDDPRMRDACCALMQAYIAYHPRPQLPWLDMTADCYQAKAGILGLEFRRLHELIEFDQVDSKTIQESGRRQANIVVMGAIHKVLAALEDVAELYRQSLSPDELVEEARGQYRLLVVTKPRLVFWEGIELGINWNRKHASWEMLLHLAAHAEKLAGVDQYDLSGVLDHRDLSVRKYNLCKHLLASGDDSPGAQLAAHIEKIPDGECYIDLEPHQLKVLDLERLGANEWTVDPSEFSAVER